MRVCCRCGRNRNVKFYVGTRGRTCQTCRTSKRGATAHGKRIEQTYGITGAEYDRLLVKQGGVCGACKQSRRYRLHIDHDHTEERDGLEAGISQPNAARWSVRGLLCKRCNKLLRDCRDSTDLLQSLANYLGNWPSEGIIK